MASLGAAYVFDARSGRQLAKLSPTDVQERDAFGESVALWVVPRDAVLEIDDFVDELGRNYHRVDGYPLKEKLREARERAGTAAPRDR